MIGSKLLGQNLGNRVRGEDQSLAGQPLLGRGERVDNKAWWEIFVRVDSKDQPEVFVASPCL